MNEIERAIDTLKMWQDCPVGYYVDKCPKKENEYCSAGCWSKDSMNQAIALALPALQAQLDREREPDGWISVEDRSPEERHYPPVICGHDKDKWTDAAIVTGRGKWINSEGCEIFPTHWMPLPQPPKEGRV